MSNCGSFSVGIASPDDNCIAAAKSSMEKLGVAQCDLYLIHNPKGKDCVATWKAMLEVKKLGLAKAVGVSNFGKAQLEGLKATGLEMPEVNQVERTSHSDSASGGALSATQAPPG